MVPLRPPSRDLIEGASLFLDFDGTLAEFVAPDVQPDVGPRTVRLLQHLSQRLDGRVALISGRSLDNLIELVDVAGLDLTGSHGLERRRADGTRDPIRADGSFDELHEDGRELGERLGLLVETKPAGAAFHYRANPDAGQLAQSAVAELADRYGLEFREGSMVFEVRAPGPHKGDALRALMAEEPFNRGTALFVGDDVTDEDGFAAARALGGHGILVGEPRESHASFVLPSVAATLEWLSA